MDEITAIRTGIELSNRIKLFLPFAANRAIDQRPELVEGPAGRKVRTAQSNAPVKSRVSPQAGTDSATENNLTPQPPLHKVERGSKDRERVKMWGKSPQLLMVTSFAGKPCMLKCHV